MFATKNIMDTEYIYATGLSPRGRGYHAEI
jgi:hypothetical protein